MPMQLLVPCVCVLACMNTCVSNTCNKGWASPGQRYEWTRQISQRLKALLPSGGNRQALMLMWTNKRKPKWVEWTIICCGEASRGRETACLLYLESRGWREEPRKMERKILCERETHTQKNCKNPNDFSWTKHQYCNILHFLCVRSLCVLNIYLNTIRSQVRLIARECRKWSLLYTL